MGINIQIENFQSTLLNDINNCNLPIGVAYLIVKDFCNMLYVEYTKSIKQEEKFTNDTVQFDILPDELGNLNVMQVNSEE